MMNLMQNLGLFSQALLLHKNWCSNFRAALDRIWATFNSKIWSHCYLPNYLPTRVVENVQVVLDQCGPSNYRESGVL